MGVVSSQPFYSENKTQNIPRCRGSDVLKSRSMGFPNPFSSTRSDIEKPMQDFAVERLVNFGGADMDRPSTRVFGRSERAESLTVSRPPPLVLSPAAHEPRLARSRVSYASMKRFREGQNRATSESERVRGSTIPIHNRELHQTFVHTLLLRFFDLRSPNQEKVALFVHECLETRLRTDRIEPAKPQQVALVAHLHSVMISMYAIVLAMPYLCLTRLSPSRLLHVVSGIHVARHVLRTSTLRKAPRELLKENKLLQPFANFILSWPPKIPTQAWRVRSCWL